jgi:hypothetical protein
MIMNTACLNLPRTHTWLRACTFAFILGGCGGGVDSGGTGGAATYANGPITGSGSIIVNGVRFDDTTASVSDDNGGSTKDALKLGMVVEVRGSALTDDPTTGGKSSTASSISFNSELLGRIDSIDPSTSSLVVIGQPVDVKTTTFFDDSLTGGLSALATGNVVEVYALYDSTVGRYAATRIERKSSVPTEFRLRGAVTALNTTTKVFNIGTEQISYATVTDLPTNLANGAILRVRVSNTGGNHVWTASRLRDGSNKPDDGSQARIEGLITAFTSVSQFSIGTVQVTTNSGTTVSGGVPALNVRVEVEGTITAGVLVASSVTIEADSGKTENQFIGPISALNTANKTFVVKGQTISYALTTDYRGGTEASLVNGVNLDVRASLANGNQLQATRIDFKP